MESLFLNTIFISLLCGAIFLAAALITYRFPPKKINRLYGYRTASSMKSQDRWEFAQRFSSIRMIKGSIVLIGLSLVGYFIPVNTEVKLMIGVVLLAGLIAYLMIGTEKAIRERFDEMP